MKVMFKKKKKEKESKKLEEIKKARENDVPQESETIAARRAVRIRKRLGKAKRGLGRTSWRIDGQAESLGLGLIWFLNLYLVLPFFGREAFLTSYSGPIIPLLGKIISWLGLPLSYSIEIVNIVFFLIFPISFYICNLRIKL